MNKRRLLGVILLVVAILLIYVVFTISKGEPTDKEDIEKQQAAIPTCEQHSRQMYKEEDIPEEFGDLRFSFSRTEKNVVIITLDRALSCFFPYIMEELPGTKDDFNGFVYYPNTLSFGSNTIYGMPPCYGGYEYTPEQMNKRNTELLKHKHNESLKVLPRLFSENDYTVTVCDPPLANYQWVPDLSIFDDLEGVKAYNTINAYEGQGNTEYSAFKKNYFVLENLSKFTNADSEKGAYISFDNEATHRYCYLELPYYTLPENETVNAYEYNWTKTSSQGESITISSVLIQQHYCVNAASLRALGEWFRTLRRLGVYDNTRIIIVADHGYGVRLDSNLIYNGFDTEYYNPLLLVKDYNASGPYKTDNTLMTNADVPTIATKGVIKNAINPYTGKVLSEQVDKKEVYVYRATDWQVGSNQGNTYTSVYYYKVKDNIFDINNWGLTRIDYGTTKKEMRAAEAAAKEIAETETTTENPNIRARR